ncbi:hypothetical protein GGI35DRAFT_483111 [Trichoderma velutinum]
MKRSIAQTNGTSDAGRPPAKRAATSTKKASDSNETSSNETTKAVAALPSQSSDDPFGKRSKIPLGPDRELMILQILPHECFKAIKKLLLPPGWVNAIDATPDRSLSLSNRRWWEVNCLWLESNKNALGLTAKHWKMREEAFIDGAPLGEDDANTPEEFNCIFPPAEEEESNDEDENDEEDEDEEDEEDGDETDELASLHPDHTWVSTLGGYERYKWWIQEILKRNQDDYSLHIYNDFSWYGTIEVLDNLFVNFERRLKSKSAGPLDLWIELEGLALLMNSGNALFEMCDDADRCEQILELFGFMTIAVIDRLQKKDLFTKDSKITNIPIMLSLLIKYAWSMGRGDYGWEDTVAWVFYVVQEAEAAEITLGGPSGFEKILEEVKDEASEHTAASLSRWTKSTFINKFKSYGSRGGDQYVIAKMPASERKKYSYGSG